MKHLILEQFWDSIPQEKVTIVRRKLPYYLNKLAAEQGNIGNMPKGFYARRIRGTENIYKFRMGNDDRILFIYAQDIKGIRQEEKWGIVLLLYCNHDEQIRKGRKIGVIGREALSECDFNMEEYQEETESVLFTQLEQQYANLQLVLDNTRSFQVTDNDLGRMAEEGVKDWQYYLNNEQYNCVQIENRPIFLSGGAGTGKSTIGLHKLFALGKNKDASLVYFTYTKALKIEFEKMYIRYQQDYQKSNPQEKGAQVDFFSFNDFAMGIIGKKPIMLVDFQKFENDFCKEKWPLFQNIAIHKVDIWQEIRGLIKGFMGKYWLRKESFHNRSKKLKTQTLAFLVAHEVIEEREKDCYIVGENYKVLYSDSPDVEREIHALLLGEQDKEEILADIKRMKRYLVKKQFAEPLISKELYLSLEDENCIFNKEERRLIYWIAENYQTWLEETGKVDENDLARQLLILAKEGRLKPVYDYIMVDEVQDLTELQIYVLLSLQRNKENFKDFFFSGDIHQMINPTYFSFSRLRMPFHYHHGEKELQLLEKNYRSQKYIVDVSNKMSELCKTYIGAKDNLSAIPLQKAGNLPFWLLASAKNRQELLTILQRNDRKYAIIVVPNEREKRRIKEEMGTSERVFTVQEIKGLEYDYVVCVNMLTPFLTEWQDIMAGKGKKNAKYRYYFNIFYVALTRAKQNLCIYEDGIEIPILHHLQEFFQQIAHFDSTKMHLKRIANYEEVANDARNQERRGNFSEAEEGYAEIGDQRGALRCRAQGFKEQGNYLAAIKSFLAAGEQDAAFNVAEELEDDTLRFFVLLQSMNTPEDIEKKFNRNNKKIHEIISKNSDDSEFIELVYKKYLAPKFEKYQKIAEDCVQGIEMVKKESRFYE